MPKATKKDREEFFNKLFLLGFKKKGGVFTEYTFKDYTLAIVRVTPYTEYINVYYNRKRPRNRVIRNFKWGRKGLNDAYALIIKQITDVDPS